MGLTEVLTDVATRLKTAEALHPVVASQREAEKETKGWDRLPPTAQRVILAASATNRTSILTSRPPTIHCFLNVRNAMSLQADCSLTYTGNNIYLPNSFCKALLQGNILAIPEPDVPTGILSLLTPPYSAGTANSQQRAMRIQVLLSIGKDLLSKEEAVELLDQRVHVLASTQELRHSTRKFVKLAGDYIGAEIMILLSMETWLPHIVRFKRQYDNASAKDPLFGADLMDRIQNVFRCFYTPEARLP